VTVFASLEQLRAAAGTDLGASGWVEVTAEQVARYGEATGDPEATYLALALTNRLMPALIAVPAASLGVNYGTGPVRLGTPPDPGARLRARARLVACDDVPGGVQTTVRVTMEVEGAAEPACEVDALSRWLA
jgi:acyl dehydratase